jgi:hypothetical protein
MLTPPFKALVEGKVAVETLRRQIRDDKTRRRPLKGRRPAELAAVEPLG